MRTDQRQIAIGSVLVFFERYYENLHSLPFFFFPLRVFLLGLLIRNKKKFEKKI